MLICLSKILNSGHSFTVCYQIKSTDIKGCEGHKFNGGSTQTVELNVPSQSGQGGGINSGQVGGQNLPLPIEQDRPLPINTLLPRHLIRQIKQLHLLHRHKVKAQ